MKFSFSSKSSYLLVIFAIKKLINTIGKSMELTTNNTHYNHVKLSKLKLNSPYIESNSLSTNSE